MRPAGRVPVPDDVDAAFALLTYEGAAREVVARLKYRDARATVAWLADGLAGLLTAAETDAHVVTWLPTTHERRRVRGFDQAELLARAVGRRLHRPVRSLLRRGAGPAQTGRTAAERAVGPALALRAGSVRPGRSVVVVDDVMTTGASLAAAGRALHAGGVELVTGLAAAYTPTHAVLRSGSRATPGDARGDHRQRSAHGGFGAAAELGGAEARPA